MIPDPIAAVWFAFIFVAEPIEQASHHRLVEAAAAIAVGMTQDEVRSVLGEPVAEYGEREGWAWLLKGSRPKQWMYGTGFNLDYLLLPGFPCLNPVPINVRIFDYADDDLIIDWTRDNRVAAILRPEFDVPDFAFQLLDAVEFATAAAHIFVLDGP